MEPEKATENTPKTGPIRRLLFVIRSGRKIAVWRYPMLSGKAATLNTVASAISQALTGRPFSFLFSLKSLSISLDFARKLSKTFFKNSSAMLVSVVC